MATDQYYCSTAAGCFYSEAFTSLYARENIVKSQFIVLGSQLATVTNTPTKKLRTIN